MICSDLSSSNPVAHKGTHEFVRSAHVANERSRSDGYHPMRATSQSRDEATTILYYNLHDRQ